MERHINITASEKELKIISKILRILLKLIQTFLKKKCLWEHLDLEKEWNDGKEETK